MNPISAATNVQSVSVYRKLNGHLNGRSVTQVNKAENTPNADNRKMGLKNAEIRVARQEKTQELYEARTAHHMPFNMAMEHAVQNRINNPQQRNTTQKTIDAVRDLRGGVHAGPLPTSAVAAQNRYHSMRINGYV
ncbi:hypothetical protein GFB49_12945 [Epibacterium sp. SM1979]|uniref:Uncharacterized protein n=1 Tax=Tritonibacter litoralis TaxID=2662264 RepID=A0A843YL04_9RHOB|nr:hypothetical protein [Tritonibacter litoralis]MQQ09367.1 hypothetical protein [Tritonibacter litoralis]